MDTLSLLHQLLALNIYKGAIGVRWLFFPSSNGELEVQYGSPAQNAICLEYGIAQNLVLVEPNFDNTK
jgi:hypothetical protein